MDCNIVPGTLTNTSLTCRVAVMPLEDLVLVVRQLASGADQWVETISSLDAPLAVRLAVTAVIPAEGSIAGGERVTVVGTGFNPVAGLNAVYMQVRLLIHKHKHRYCPYFHLRLPPRCLMLAPMRKTHMHKTYPRL